MVEAGDLAADRTETSIGGGGGGLFHAKTDIDTLRLLSLSPRILVTGIHRPTHSSVAGELMPGPLLLSAFQ